MGLLSVLGTIGGSLIPGIGPAIGGAIGGALGGALEGSSSDSPTAAAREAASTTAAATNRAAELQRQSAQEQLALQQRMYEEGVARQQPWLSAGQNALAQMQGQYGAMPAAFSGRTNAMPAAFTGQVDLTQDPGYAFRLAEGQKAIERSAAARGMQLSGATLKGLTKYGQDLGSQEYANAYNRALTQYNAAVQREQTGYGRSLDEYNAALQREATGYNRLASMAGIGQTTANTLGTAGQNYAQQVGNISSNMASNIGNALINQGYTSANAGLVGAASRQSAYGDINQALGRITPGQWSSASTSIGNWLGNPATAWKYGTKIGSQQTAMLAAAEEGF